MSMSLSLHLYIIIIEIIHKTKRLGQFLCVITKWFYFTNIYTYHTVETGINFFQKHYILLFHRIQLTHEGEGTPWALLNKIIWH